MKKIMVYLVVIAFIGAVLSGCSSTQGTSDDYFGYNPKPKVVEKEDNFHANYVYEGDSTDTTNYNNGGYTNGNPYIVNNYYPDNYGYYSPWSSPYYGYGYPMLTFGYNNFYMGYGYSPFYNPYYSPYYRYNYWDYGFYPYYGYTNYGGTTGSPRKDRDWGPNRGGYENLGNTTTNGTWINKRTGASGTSNNGNNGQVMRTGNANYFPASGSNNTRSNNSNPSVQVPKGNTINRTGGGNQTGTRRSTNVMSTNDTYRYDAIKKADRTENTFRAKGLNSETQRQVNNQRVFQNNNNSNRSVTPNNNVNRATYSAPTRTYSAPARSYSAPARSSGGGGSVRSSSGGGSHSRGK